MSSPVIGQIMIFGGNSPPAGWALCAGQILSIAENRQLFQLIGNSYGGDGVTTFALPNLRSRLPLGQARPAALSCYQLAQRPSQPHQNLQPCSMFNFCIALSGANP
jgi:microcystin-dependent protein